MFDMRNRRWKILPIALVLGVTVIAGCGGGGMLDTLFRISSVSAVLPHDWSSQGGLLHILADVSGYTAVRKVIAFVKKVSSNESTPIEMAPNREGQFVAKYYAPPNTDPTQPAEYSVIITATDTSGKEVSSDAVSFEVPPAYRPSP